MAIAVPGTTLINSYTEREEETGRLRLFNLKDTKIKAFWIAAAVGFVLTLPSWLVRTFMPTLVLGFGGQDITLDWSAISAPILPGVIAMNYFRALAFGALLLVPTDISATLLVAWLLWGIIIPYIGVMQGWIPYQSGMETDPYYIYTGRTEIFPYQYMASYGMTLGLGLYLLWSCRKGLIRAFRGLV